MSSTEVRSLATLYKFVKPGELIDGVAEHAVFQRFWKDARPDTFAPSAQLLAARASKMR